MKGFFYYLALFFACNIGDAHAANDIERQGGKTDDSTQACYGILLKREIRFERAPPPLSKKWTCFIDAPIRLLAMPRPGDKTEILFSDRPLLACSFALQFVQFVGDVADPLSVAALKSSLKNVETGPGFECRFRNRALSGKMSAHGRGLAVDIRAVTLKDERRLMAGSANGTAEGAYLSNLSKTACGFFSTVLSPGSDPLHKDHFHLDAEPRQSRMAAHFCQP